LPAQAAVEGVSLDAGPADDLDLEVALGGGIRKAPAVVAALDEAEVVEG
jgi:small subunit ribosomal protein S2